MFEKITPIQAGSTSADILEFMQIIDEYCPGMHSVILSRGGKIFHECYYAPFHKDYLHRMYSVTKSFVSVAIGLLIEDGKLQLTDRFVDLFPEYTPEDVDPKLAELTLRDMLTMSTAHSNHVYWFDAHTDDRLEVYFRAKPDKIPGTQFDYDSSGSYMMGAVVERITGMPFMDFLRERIFRHIGFSDEAYCLKAPGRHSWGDSAILCTSRDLLAFAQFVMNQGTWEGERYMNADYLAEATRRQVDNNEWGLHTFDKYGYGYQFWISKNGRFFFNGMGCQFGICDPEHDFVCVVNADCQGNPIAKQMIFHALYHHIIDKLDTNDTAKVAAESNFAAQLQTYTADLRLSHLPGPEKSAFAAEIAQKTYRLEENPMGIRRVKFEFGEGCGKITYVNATGEKVLPFGFGYNEFGKFPEEGYSDEVGGVYAPGNFYDCAASAAWVEPKKLQIKVQVIDKYFGNGVWTFSFKDDRVNVTMTKTAEDFMDEYNGRAVGQAISAYGPRENTDALFELPAGSQSYQGRMDWGARYIEDLQLMDAPLWKLFVEQFRSNVDDSDKGWRCEYWGKMMRGACMTYAYTKNPELYAVLTETVRDMLTAQDELGRFSTYSVEAEFDGWDMWGRKYILLGFQYFIEICSEPALVDEILAALERHADYIMERVGREEEGKRPITSTTTHWKGMNSSSILEPFVRMYNLTGAQKYLDFATYIVDTGFIEGDNVIQLAYEGVLKPYEYPVTKAYETMSCFEGLLEYYRVTGDERHLIAVKNFVQGVMETDVTVIGCCGCTHELFDNSAKHQTNMQRNLEIHQQETCVTVTWMKICYQLLCLTGDPVYADAIEISAFNALHGSINVNHMRTSVPKVVKYQPPKHPVDENTILLPFDSYSPLLPNTRGTMVGGFKSMGEGTFYGCCACIGSAGTGLLPAMAAMKRRDGIAINYYGSGTIQTVTPGGQPLTLTIETGYPYDGDVKIRVNLPEPEYFTLALRIPGWCEMALVFMDGEELEVAKGYAEFVCPWSDGDEIGLQLDMPIVTHEQDGYVAYQKGPIMLATDARLNAGEELSPAPQYRADLLLENGGVIKLIDYASAGQTWDERSKMAVWNEKR